MSEYPKNITINQDTKSSFWFVSFEAPDGRKRRSTKVPVAGGKYKQEVLTKAQAKNRALLVGMRIAEDDCKKKNAEIIPVKDFLFAYLEKRKPYIASATYINMRSAYSRFCDYLKKRSELPLTLIRRDDAKSFIEWRRLEVRAKSVKKDVAALNAAFNDAVDSEILVRNPFVRLKIQPDTQDEKLTHEAFTFEEIKFLISNFPPEWSSAVRCSFETYGQRLGDILSLRWSQFDFENKVVRITTGKTSNDLVQPMREEFFTWAKERFEELQAKPDDLLHPNLLVSGKRASAEFGQLLRSYRIGVVSSEAGGKRRNVNSKTFHSIRATCATLLQQAGVSSDMAAKLVGHDSQDVHKQYVRPDEAQLRELANKLPGF